MLLLLKWRADVCALFMNLIMLAVLWCISSNHKWPLTNTFVQISLKVPSTGWYASYQPIQYNFLFVDTLVWYFYALAVFKIRCMWCYYWLADMQVDGYLCLDFNLFHLFPLFLLFSHMRVWGTPSRLDYSLYLVMSKNYLSESKLLQRVYFSYSFEKNVRKKKWNNCFSRDSLRNYSMEY